MEKNIWTRKSYLGISEIKCQVLYYRISVLRCGITEIVLTIVDPTVMDLTIIKNVHSSKSNGHLAFESSLHEVNSSFLIQKTYSKVK